MYSKLENAGTSVVSPAIRTGLAAIPNIGAPIAQAWSEWDSLRRFQRVEKAIDSLSQALSTIGSEFNVDSLGDEEFQLLDEILRRVQVEHNDLKRGRLEQLLACSWIETPRLEFSERMRHVRAVEEFEEHHIAILSLLCSSADEQEFPSYADIGDALNLAVEHRDEVLIPAINALVAKYGFVKRSWGMSDGSSFPLLTKNLSPEGIARKCQHHITDAGHRFLRSLIKTSNVTKQS